MKDKYTIGPDIDLDAEVVLDRRGQRIGEARAERIAEEALAKAAVGRPSLTGPGHRSPEVKARVSAELRDRLRDEARKRGVSTSELVREALDRFLRAS